MLKVLSMQTVKSKLNASVRGESPAESNITMYGNAGDVKVVFGRDRGVGYDLTSNAKFTL
jgi:hypothetical protein